MASFLNPVDETIADSPDYDHVVEQIAQAYTRSPENDPDGPRVPTPESISNPQALSAVATLQSFTEKQEKDHRGLLRHLASLEREMKALQLANPS